MNAHNQRQIHLFTIQFPLKNPLNIKKIINPKQNLPQNHIHLNPHNKKTKVIKKKMIKFTLKDNLLNLKFLPTNKNFIREQSLPKKMYP